ncbi:T-cell receptor [Labeo rohita]|nr:T-cell receptor [Labeo rohita]RXN21652.1 T-cell receptor [Labeo rohita]
MTVGNKKVFGSGTRLYVADKVSEPKVYGYLPSKSDPPNGKQTMLCQASEMFPDLVTFEWKKDGKVVSEGDVVEQRKEKTEKTPVSVTSMLILNKDKVTSDGYECIVTHKRDTDKSYTVLLKKDKPSGQPEDSNKENAACTPSTEKPKNVDTSDRDMAMVDLRQSDVLVRVTRVQKPMLRHTARGRATLEEAVVL